MSVKSKDATLIATLIARVEVLPEPETKWSAPFLAINKSVVTMVREIKG